MSKKSSKDAATSTSTSIEEQTAAFLKSGGSIQKIEKGTSGQFNSASSKQPNDKKAQ